MEKEISPLDLFDELRVILESLDCEESATSPALRSEVSHLTVDERPVSALASAAAA